MDRQVWQTVGTQRSSLICGQTGLANSGDPEEQSDLSTDRAVKQWGLKRSSLICGQTGLANSGDSEEPSDLWTDRAGKHWGLRGVV